MARGAAGTPSRGFRERCVSGAARWASSGASSARSSPSPSSGFSPSWRSCGPTRPRPCAGVGPTRWRIPEEDQSLSRGAVRSRRTLGGLLRCCCPGLEGLRLPPAHIRGSSPRGTVFRGELGDGLLSSSERSASTGCRAKSRTKQAFGYLAGSRQTCPHHGLTPAPLQSATAALL